MSSEPDLFLDGETSIRSIDDLSELPFLDRISHVSFSLLFCLIEYVTEDSTHSLWMKNG